MYNPNNTERLITQVQYRMRKATGLLTVNDPLLRKRIVYCGTVFHTWVGATGRESSMHQLLGFSKLITVYCHRTLRNHINDES